MRSVVFLVTVGFLSSLSLSVQAKDNPDDTGGGYIDPNRPVNLKIPVPDDLLPDPGTNPQPAVGAGTIIYFNRHGGTYSRGINDSRTNRSSIVNGTVTIPPFPYGDATWAQIMECNRQMWAPFNVVVTDQDPGNTPHIESVIAGHPSDAGFPNDVGGVAPFDPYCKPIENAIVFSFAEVWGANVRANCETAAQETAHAFNLDHEYYCPDPMTYIFGCGEKWFRDYDAPCGEYSARSCQCGGSTQNSFRRLLALFGARTQVPPELTLLSPRNGDTVQPGFIIRAQVTDDVGILKVEAFVDGQRVGVDDREPYEFGTPLELTEGQYQIRVLATDLGGLTAEQIADVDLKPPCASSGECASDQVCLGGNCVPGPGSGNGLGDPCVEGTDCYSNLCVQGGEDWYCVDFCSQGAANCPGGFECVSTGNTNNPDEGVCWPSGGGGGCCGVAGQGVQTRPIPWFAVGLAFLGLLVIRRRR